MLITLLIREKSKPGIFYENLEFRDIKLTSDFASSISNNDQSLFDLGFPISRTLNLPASYLPMNI